MIETSKQDTWSKCRVPTTREELNAENPHSLPVLTLREMSMVEVMEDLTDIPEWWKKVSCPQYSRS
jgi:hypothetical protein